MLYLVLALVVAAFGLLVAALTTQAMVWAWISVGVSILAGVVLVVDSVRRRRAAAAPDADDDDEDDADEPSKTEVAPADEHALTAEPEPVPGTGSGPPSKVAAPVFGEPEPVKKDKRAGSGPPSKVAAPVFGEPEPVKKDKRAGSGPPSESASAEPELGDAEPDEEDTDAADVLVVSELEAEVVVLDERPRYHLAGCRWLRDRETIPLPVREARELGFTPCGVCTPDRKLAARHRRAGRIPTE